MTAPAIPLPIEALAALGNFTPSGSGYKLAHCPHPDHPDLHPSCSLFTGEDGNPKFHCLSRGCDPKEIGEALGIKRVGGQWYYANDKVTSAKRPTRSKRRSTSTTKPFTYATPQAAVNECERQLQREHGDGAHAGKQWRYTDRYFICRFDLPARDDLIKPR